MKKTYIGTIAASVILFVVSVGCGFLPLATFSIPERMVYFSLCAMFTITLAMAPLVLGLCFSVYDHKKIWLHAGLLVTLCEAIGYGLYSWMKTGSLLGLAASLVLFCWVFWVVVASIYLVGLLLFRGKKPEGGQWKKSMAIALAVLVIVFVASCFVMNHAMNTLISMQGEVSPDGLAKAMQMQSLYSFCSQAQICLVLLTLVAGVFFGLGHRSLAALNGSALCAVGEIALLALLSLSLRGSAFTYTENFQFSLWFYGLFIGIYVAALVCLLRMRKKENVRPGTIS